MVEAYLWRNQGSSANIDDKITFLQSYGFSASYVRSPPLGFGVRIEGPADLYQQVFNMELKPLILGEQDKSQQQYSAEGLTPTMPSELSDFTLKIPKSPLESHIPEDPLPR